MFDFLGDWLASHPLASAALLLASFALVMCGDLFQAMPWS